jgi:predicted phosphodiesterase
MRPESRWRLGVVADAHLAPATAAPYTWQNTVDLPRSAELLDAGLAWLAAQDIDALALLGDLTESADPASFASIREQAMMLGVPVVAVPGNCDVDSTDRSLSAFAAISGDLVLIGPDHLRHAPEWTLELVHLEAAGEKRLRGVRSSETGARHETRVVLTHYPVLELESELIAAGFRHSGDLTNRVEIEQDLRALGMPVVVIHGHLHIHDARISGNLLHLSCGALIEPPHYVAVVELTTSNDQIAVERWSQSIRPYDTDRLPLFAPDHARWVWCGVSWSAA